MTIDMGKQSRKIRWAEFKHFFLKYKYPDNNVMAWGADPTGKRDSWGAITAMGKHVYPVLPAGTFKVSESISGSIRGAGSDKTGLYFGSDPKRLPITTEAAKKIRRKASKKVIKEQINE